MSPSWTIFLERVNLDILEIYDDNIMIYLNIFEKYRRHHLHHISSEFAESMLYSCSIDEEIDPSNGPNRLLGRQRGLIGQNTSSTFKCILENISRRHSGAPFYPQPLVHM